jgi:ubiquitin-protein ligase
MYKRLYKEVKQLIIQQNQKPLIENDYIIYYDDSDLRKIYALIKAPYDSVYRHKFIKLEIKIPDNYPHSPPEVYFVNHDSVRIHPNMYEDGKCCATILNTWGDDKFEKWTSSMGIETILLTFHSFLDNNPYTYEPGGRDEPSYTVYVLHQSWYTCLIRYLQYEKIDIFIQMIQNYMMLNIENIFQELNYLNLTYPCGLYHTRCFEVDNYNIDYERIMSMLQNMYCYIDYKENYLNENELPIEFNEFIDKDYKCNICFDTDEDDKYIVLKCNHTFHKKCLNFHVKTNVEICSMCRNELDDDILKQLNDNETDENNIEKRKIADGWIINPLTKRRVKIGSKTYNNLKDTGVI